MAINEAKGHSDADDVVRTIPTEALIVVAVLAATFLRLILGGAFGVMWAEDGGVFLNVPLAEGVWGSLGHRYNGYLHTLPMLIGNVAAAAPLEYAAILVTTITGVVVGLLAAHTYRVGYKIVNSSPLRLVVAASFVMLPIAGFGVGAANMLHFFLVFALAWSLVADAQDQKSTVGTAVIAFFAATSSSIALIVAPLIVWRWRRQRPALIAYGTGVVIQLVAMATTTRDVEVPPRSGTGAVYGLVSVITRGAYERRFVPVEPSFLALAGIGLLVVLFVGALRRERLHAAILLGVGALFWAIAYSTTGWAMRYGILPGLCSVGAIVVLVQHQRRVVTSAVIAVLLASWVLAAPTPQYRRSGPTWAETMSLALERCPGQETVALEVAPTVGYGQDVTLPCDRLP